MRRARSSTPRWKSSGCAASRSASPGSSARSSSGSTAPATCGASSGLPWPREDAGGTGAPAPAPTPSADHVDRLLALIRDALTEADGRRLERVGDDRWWLGDRADGRSAAPPLGDRVEWAVYSLLSTAGPLSEAAFLDRIAGLFTGPDLPDEALVRACLESYRSLAEHPRPAGHDRRSRAPQPGARRARRRRRRPRAPPRVLVLDRFPPAPPARRRPAAHGPARRP